MTPRAVLNRILLVLTGLVLLAGGLLILAAGADLYGWQHLSPPPGWPLTAPGDVLLASADRIRWSSQGWWWWPAVIAALVLITALALGWLLAQLHRRRPRAVSVGGTPPQEGVELRVRALGDALAQEAGALPGVARADVRITGRPDRPHAHISLALTPEGRPEAVLQALCEGPLRTVHECTGASLPAQAHLHVARHKPRRVL
ncbi:Asp23/Gls24 family envelope stress response protein [Streptomyces mexicanus]|uniref:alkaline shock response membrane anchor protein AmaP n=1 Tax=Streptomyces mexicanus TaxID=178566 RepID=UPI0036682249